MKAFVLGAGLGTRLRPLTDRLPKPMIPLWNKPLIAWAFDHLMAGGFRDFMVNTHHLPEAYGRAFPQGSYRGCPLAFRHEPVLLETGGGIANIRDWLPERDSFAVYNGDILSDLPLEAALDRHLNSGDWGTLVLRTAGDSLQVAWDGASGLVTDIRGQLHPGSALPCYQFTGIYLLRPAFLDLLAPGKKESVIPAFMAALRAGKLGGVVIDAGRWSDLGDPASYLEASTGLAAGGFPGYEVPEADRARRIHPAASLAPGARIDETTSLGEGCEIGEGAVLERCLVWPGARVGGGALRRDEIVL